MLLASYVEPLVHVNLIESLFQALHEAKGVALAIKNSLTGNILFDVISIAQILSSLELLVFLIKVKLVSVDPVEADVDINFISKENPSVLFHASDY